MASDTNNFKYTYSAKEQEELKKIREKYTQKEESKFDRLRRLDSAATNKAQCLSLTLGIIGLLVLGLGMSLCMSDLGDKLSISPALCMIIGVCIGILGSILVGCAYPFYNIALKRERKRIAPEILRLTDELLK